MEKGDGHRNEHVKKNNTWEIEKAPENCKIINSKWVFKIKELPNGKSHFKARLVARGFEQEDLDLQVYALVAKLLTLG